MNLLRLYVATKIKLEQEFLILDKENLKHIKVMRLKQNDLLNLFAGDGFEYLAKIKKISKESVTLDVIEKTSPKTESSLNIELACPFLAGKKMDLVVEKAVELGVQKITPLIFAKSKEKIVQFKKAHFENIIISATKQSKRCILPIILEPISFLDFCNIKKNSNQTKFIALPNAQNKLVKFKETLQKDFLILTGSKSGFTKQEEQEAKSMGFIEFSLGARILRAETAAIVSVCLFDNIFS